MLPNLETRVNDLTGVEEFVRAVADLVLGGSGEFTTTYEITNEVCDRYFAPASAYRATNVAAWPTSKAQQSTKLEDQHETRTSRPVHSSCA
jgi:hypothetical protein